MGKEGRREGGREVRRYRKEGGERWGRREEGGK